MVTYKGDVKTAVDAGGLGNTVVQGLIDGRVKCMLDSLTIAGTELSGSVIKMGQALPAGAKVLAIILYVSAAQTSLTSSVGDGASATRYGSALTSLQTAGSYFIGGQNYVVGTTSGDDQLTLTTGGATATAGTLKSAVLYTLD